MRNRNILKSTFNNSNNSGDRNNKKVVKTHEPSKIKKANEIDSNFSSKQDNPLKRNKTSQSKKDQDSKEKETYEDINNYMKLNYYLSKSKIRENIENDDDTHKESTKQDEPTEYELVKKMEDLNKKKIPKCKYFYFNGDEMKKLDRNELNKGKSKKKGIHNMALKPNPDNMFLGQTKNMNNEMKRMPVMLDTFIEKREKEKNEADKKVKGKIDKRKIEEEDEEENIPKKKIKLIIPIPKNKNSQNGGESEKSSPKP